MILTTRAVLYHKTPAIWSRLASFDEDAPASVEELKNSLGELDLKEVPIDIMNTDIYVGMVRWLAEQMNVDEIHIVQGYESSEAKNWTVSSEMGFHEVSENIYYWSVDNAAHLIPFMDNKFMMTRGNYPRLHINLASIQPKHGVWLHYAATSLHLPHLQNMLDWWGEHHNKSMNHHNRFYQFINLLINNNPKLFSKAIHEKFDELQFSPGDKTQTELIKELKNWDDSRFKELKKSPYDIILIDDSSTREIMNKVHPRALIYTFVKPCLEHETPAQKEEFDVVFAGTSLQKTKNHSLFTDLLSGFDKILNRKIKVAILGNLGGDIDYQNALDIDYEMIDINDMGQLSREEALSVFAKSRSLLLTSGRDANPRVISEAATCGAKVIALDILSDGFEVLSLNPAIGSLIEVDPFTKSYVENGNFSCMVTPDLVKDVLNKIEDSASSIFTREVAKRLFDLPTNLEESLAAIIALS